MNIKLGVRWDDEIQNKRLIKAKDQGLIDYIEVNYPIAAHEKPFEVELPIYAHSAYNGLCSAYGLNGPLVEIIKNEADKYNSPWIGEHLSWLASNEKGALGYVFNTIYNQDFFNITINNIKRLQNIYQRPIALELGPQYELKGDIGSRFKDEIDFLLKVAKETNSYVILDLSHLMISNINLDREIDYGIDQFLNAQTIEVHVSGIRKSKDGKFWHDCHDNLPSRTTLNLLSTFCKKSSSLKAVTIEHSQNASESDFFKIITSVRDSLEITYVS